MLRVVITPAGLALTIYAVIDCIQTADAQVKYSSLPNYEEKEEDFRAESVLLRRRAA